MSVFNEKDQSGVSPALPPPLQLFFLSEGAVISTALSLAADLGLADLLADGPRSSEELARPLLPTRALSIGSSVS